MRLSGKDKQKIREALRHAFPAPGQLRVIVSDADIGTSFDDISFRAPSYDVAIADLLAWSEGQNRLLKLLAAAGEAAPDNPDLADVVHLASRYGSFRPDRPLEDVECILFQDVGFQNVREWLNKLDRLRRAICRVEPQPPSAGIGGYGTGFLVAPDIVLTNDHVASGLDGAGFWGRPDLAGQVRCRFDCEYREDGSVSEGTVCALAKDYPILRSPVAELDFALVKLDRRVGEEAIDGWPRGYVTPVAHDFETGEPLLILQHPHAQPMKLAFGAIAPKESWPANHVEYIVNTAAGSSGSPVATQALEVAALHHRSSGTSNRGVLMSAILSFLRSHRERDRLAQAGLGHLICVESA